MRVLLIIPLLAGVLGLQMGCLSESAERESYEASAVAVSPCGLGDEDLDFIVQTWDTLAGLKLADKNRWKWQTDDTTIAMFDNDVAPAMHQGRKAKPDLVDLIGATKIGAVLDVGPGDNHWARDVINLKGNQSPWGVHWVTHDVVAVGVDLVVQQGNIWPSPPAYDPQKGFFYLTYTPAQSVPKEREGEGRYAGIANAIRTHAAEGVPGKFDLIHQSWGYPPFITNPVDDAIEVLDMIGNEGWLLILEDVYVARKLADLAQALATTNRNPGRLRLHLVGLFDQVHGGLPLDYPMPTHAIRARDNEDMLLYVFKVTRDHT